MALVVNPQRPKAAELCDGWTERVAKEHCHGHLSSAASEKVAVDATGFLGIPWPISEDGSDLGVDVLLATATDPTIGDGRYPCGQQIAEAWNTREGRNYVDYFRKNRAHGIKTFQDDIIEARLRELGQ